MVRPPLVAAAALLSLAIEGPGGAEAAAEAVVRVLLHEGAGPVEIDPPGAGRLSIDAADGALRVAGRRLANWRGASGVSEVAGLRVRGRVEVFPSEAGLAVVNVVPIEDYVAGILGREMIPSWKSQALEAQAIVSRTYALHQQARRRSRPWDVRSGTKSQVYGGVAAETPRTRKAVERTAGQVLTWRGEPILAVFHSASGGQTASAEEIWGRSLPYLRSIPVEDEDDSPATYWRAAITHTTLARALDEAGHPIGALRSARVVDRSECGRVLRVEFAGRSGRVALSGGELRRALGEGTLKSTMFEVRKEAENVVFVGSGHGHGVGMSQWGARAMAEQGADHEEILSRFYPGARLERVSNLSRRTAHVSGADR